MSKRIVFAALTMGAMLAAASVARGDEPPDREPPPPPIERETPAPPPDSVAGALVPSNGDRVEGRVHLTRDATLRFYDPAKKKLLSVRLDELTHLEQKPVDERMEKEWRWKENANDEKVYTGREYPMRELETTLHFKDGRALTGPLAALVFVANANGEQRFLLHKRQKGEPGQTLADLVYVALVDFRPPAKTEPAPLVPKGPRGPEGKEPDAPKKPSDAK